MENSVNGLLYVLIYLLPSIPDLGGTHLCREVFPVRAYWSATGIPVANSRRISYRVPITAKRGSDSAGNTGLTAKADSVGLALYGVGRTILSADLKLDRDR